MPQASDGSDWAYDIADLIALLDDPNPWIASTAWVQVVAMGELAVWGTIGTFGAVSKTPAILAKIGPLFATSGPLFACDTGLLNSNPSSGSGLAGKTRSAAKCSE